MVLHFTYGHMELTTLTDLVNESFLAVIFTAVAAAATIILYRIKKKNGAGAPILSTLETQVKKVAGV